MKLKNLSVWADGLLKHNQTERTIEDIDQFSAEDLSDVALFYLCHGVPIRRYLSKDFTGA